MTGRSYKEPTNFAQPRATPKAGPVSAAFNQDLAAPPRSEEGRSARNLTCELSPDGTLAFSYQNPFGPDEPDVKEISGVQNPGGKISGQQSGTNEAGVSYVVRTGEPGLASDTLEHETLPRVAKTCREALKP